MKNVVRIMRRKKIYKIYRSGFEERVAKSLNKISHFEYESLKIEYVKPATHSKYTPDFILPNGIIVETKGRFVIQDRKKHLLIQEQHPELDIRFVFENPNVKITKRSKTTYANWCAKHGFTYASGTIPKTWVEELPARSFELLKKSHNIIKITVIENCEDIY